MHYKKLMFQFLGTIKNKVTLIWHLHLWEINFTKSPRIHLSLCGTTLLSEVACGRVLIRSEWESGGCQWTLPSATRRVHGDSPGGFSVTTVGLAWCGWITGSWSWGERYLQVPLPDFTREEMLAQETDKPAECHIASKWRSQYLNQGLLDSCIGFQSSGPAGRPAVSKWCFLGWPLGS